MLIAGCAPAIKERLAAKVVVTLQGDDIFLDGLTQPYKSQAFHEIRSLSKSVDAYIAASHYYADYMSEYLGIERPRIHVVPLGIDVSDFHEFAPPRPLRPRPEKRPPTIGYLARIAPEKGFHLLVDAFIELRRRGMHDLRLEAAGWLGDHRRDYLEQQVAKIQQAGALEQFRYWGAVSREQKLDFLKSVDIMSVPTVYREPKGLFVLESLAAGVPVVEPDHGAFPELLSKTGGGVLVTPNNLAALSDEIGRLLADPKRGVRFASRGRDVVHSQLNSQSMAELHLDILKGLTSDAVHH
jgi:glycosyltransferase involved in cell wall biosynthesis